MVRYVLKRVLRGFALVSRRSFFRRRAAAAARAPRFTSSRQARAARARSPLSWVVSARRRTWAVVAPREPRITVYTHSVAAQTPRISRARAPTRVVCELYTFYNHIYPYSGLCVCVEIRSCIYTYRHLVRHRSVYIYIFYMDIYISTQWSSVLQTRYIVL